MRNRKDVVWLPFCFPGRGVRPGRKSVGPVAMAAKIPVELEELDPDRAPLVALLPLPVRRHEDGYFLRPTVHPDAPAGLKREQFGRLLNGGRAAQAWLDYPLCDFGDRLPDHPFFEGVLDGADMASNERGVVEGHARAAARGLCVHRGVVWRATVEPVLTVGPSGRGMRGPATVAVALAPGSHFTRIDLRIDGLARAERVIDDLAARYGMAKAALPRVEVRRPDLLAFEEDRAVAQAVVAALRTVASPTVEEVAKGRPAFARLAEVSAHWGPSMDPAAVLAPAAALLMKPPPAEEKGTAGWWQRDGVIRWLHHDGLAAAKPWLLDWAAVNEADMKLAGDDETALAGLAGGP